MGARVFIDGAQGTVGLALMLYLQPLQHTLGLSLGVLREDLRKDLAARRTMMAWADIVVLCLPAEAAVEAVAMALDINPRVRILDASSAHRCSEGWTYGLAEIVSPNELKAAQFVANPGCFATACILAAKPLADQVGCAPMVFHGVAGYSAAGHRGESLGITAGLLMQYGQEHRHLPEIRRYGLVDPVLTVMLGNWRRGMLVQTHVMVPVDEVLSRYRVYDDTAVRVQLAADVSGRVSAQACLEDDMAVRIVVAPAAGGTSLAVVLDNLGKGAAGAAVQNLVAMVGGAL